MSKITNFGKPSSTGKKKTNSTSKRKGQANTNKKQSFNPPLDQLANLCSIMNHLPPLSSSEASLSQAAESAQAAASSIASHMAAAPGCHLAPLQASSTSRIAVASKLTTQSQASASFTSSIQISREEQMRRSKEFCRGSQLIAASKVITDSQQAPTLPDITAAQSIAGLSSNSTNSTATSSSPKAKKKKTNVEVKIIMKATKCTEHNNITENANRPPSSQLPPMPIMPEPQMDAYIIMKRSGNVSKCHGCGSTFQKESYVLQRKEKNWWPKVVENTKRWTLSERNFYYCPNMACLIKRRPLLIKENVTIFYTGENSVENIRQELYNFEF